MNPKYHKAGSKWLKVETHFNFSETDGMLRSKTKTAAITVANEKLILNFYSVQRITCIEFSIDVTRYGNLHRFVDFSPVISSLSGLFVAYISCWQELKN